MDIKVTSAETRGLSMEFGELSHAEGVVVAALVQQAVEVKRTVESTSLGLSISRRSKAFRMATARLDEERLMPDVYAGKLAQALRPVYATLLCLEELLGLDGSQRYVAYRWTAKPEHRDEADSDLDTYVSRRSTLAVGYRATALGIYMRADDDRVHVAGTVYTTDERVVSRCMAANRKHQSPKVESDSGRMVAAVTSPTGGIQLVTMACAPTAIKPDNYTAGTMSAFKSFVEATKSDDPSGRILLLSGPPGCGKTYLVNNIMKEVKDGVFLLVPPDGLLKLLEPASLQALRDVSSDSYSAHHDGQAPLVLVLEDADSYITAREDGNDSSAGLAAVLNFADGLIGRSLNIYVVATSNLMLNSIDKALTRPGRLCAYAYVDVIEPERLSAVVKSVASQYSVDLEALNACIPNRPVTLAEVYAAAKALHARSVNENFAQTARKRGMPRRGGVIRSYASASTVPPGAGR